MANRPNQAALFDLQMPREVYYAEVTTYVNNYLWKIEDFPEIDARLWQMMSFHAAEYFQAVKIRDDAISTGKELQRNFLMENEKDQTMPP